MMALDDLLHIFYKAITQICENTNENAFLNGLFYAGTVDLLTKCKF